MSTARSAEKWHSLESVLGVSAMAFPFHRRGELRVCVCGPLILGRPPYTIYSRTYEPPVMTLSPHCSAAREPIPTSLSATTIYTIYTLCVWPRNSSALSLDAHTSLLTPPTLMVVVAVEFHWREWKKFFCFEPCECIDIPPLPLYRASLPQRIYTHKCGIWRLACGLAPL